MHGPGEDSDLAARLAEIETDHPHWHCWAGVGGLVYARRPRSSPPVTVRAATPGELVQLIEDAEQGRGWPAS